MTGMGRGSGGPPWSVDLLADLQAGVLDPQQAAELRQRVDADPEAREILAALEATEADLREFALAPAPPMPAHFAARLDASIAAESQARAHAMVPQQAPPPQRELQYAGSPPPGGQPAPVASLADARKRRNRRLGIGTGIFVAAAAVIGVAIAVLPNGGDSTNGVAQPPPGGAPPAQGPLNFKSDELGKDQLDAARNQTDYGPFADQQKRSACFEANGIAPTAEPLGGKQVTVDGKPGTLFVLVSGAGQFRLLAVGPDCGPGNPSALADKRGVK
jgi:hypothetical protein